MQYSEGRIGRIFMIRIDDGEDLLEELRRFAERMNVKTGTIQFLGALKQGRMVTGPEEPVIPPVPHWEMYNDGWEVIGFATLYPGENGPSIHVHASLGKGGSTKTGCLRKQAEAYLVVEAVLTEYVGISARRMIDEKTGLHLPALDNQFT
jgi:uncharacterized protein